MLYQTTLLILSHSKLYQHEKSVVLRVALSLLSGCTPPEGSFAPDMFVFWGHGNIVWRIN